MSVLKSKMENGSRKSDAPVSDRDNRQSPESPRDLLLRSAKEIFSQFGFEGSTTAAICRRAGMNAAQVNYYFRSKIDLYKTLLARIGENELDRLVRLLRPASSADEFHVRLEHFASEYLTWFARDIHSFRILMYEYLRGMPISKDTFERRFGPLQSGLTDYLAKAARSKIIRSDIDARVVATGILGGLQAIVAYQALNYERAGLDIADERRRKEIATNLVNTFISGLKSTESGDANDK